MIYKSMNKSGENAVVLVDEWVEFDLNTAENVWVIDDLS